MDARWTGPAWVLMGLVWAAPAGAGEPAREEPSGQMPRLDWDAPVWCTQSPEGEWIRMQCDENAAGGPRCLVARDTTRDGQPLKRTRLCESRRSDLRNRLESSGYRMVTAIAEAPPGWYRDEHGRVFQVTFDLMKRFHLGVGWVPAFDPSGKEAAPGRARFEMGLVASWLAAEQRNRHTIRAVEGLVVLEDLEVEGLLFAYDLSHASTTPLLRITTFFGAPRRHDVYMNVGLGLRLMDIHVHPHRAADLIDLEFGEFHAAWDIWQSPDLFGSLRLETGLGVAGMWETRDATRASYMLTPQAALRAKFGLDPDGFHNLQADVHWIMPVLLSGDDPWATRSRSGARAAYEVIFLAVNDQPLSLRLEAGIDYRDDLPVRFSKWDASVLAGVRFSFWAPARLHEDLPHLGNP